MARSRYCREQKERFFELVDRGGTVPRQPRRPRCTQTTVSVASPGGVVEATTDPARLHGCREGGVLPTVGREVERIGCRQGNGVSLRDDLRSEPMKPGSSPAKPARSTPAKRSSCRCARPAPRGPKARAQAGADARSATDWDKGSPIINRGRSYPDGRVVRHQESKMAGMEPQRRTRAVGGSVDLNHV